MTLEEIKPTKRIIRLPQVLDKVGKSRASIYRAIAEGTFPKPLALSERSRGWLESEIDKWIESRISKSPHN